MWYLYLIQCVNGALYAGITKNVEARYKVHRAGRGAKYTRANPPVRLIGSKPFPNRSAAAKAEAKIKRLPANRKVAFLEPEGSSEHSAHSPQ